MPRKVLPILRRITPYTVTQAAESGGPVSHTTGAVESKNSGVDLTLIRALLRLTPLERLRRMERAARDTRKLNEYGRRHRQARTGPVR